MKEIDTVNITPNKLSRNPLGIIVLFIILVYGLAALVLIFSDYESFKTEQMQLLIYFLVFFPAVVLGVFAWLITSHHWKLYNITKVPMSRHPHFFKQAHVQQADVESLVSLPS